jgi:AcrR family transcriptional regulator
VALTREQSAAATRAKILDAAGCCFRTTGYDRTGVRDIVREAGMSTGAFFAHWPTKEACYRDVFGHAPVSAEHGRALLLASRDVVQGRGLDTLTAVVATVEEA